MSRLFRTLVAAVLLLFACAFPALAAKSYSADRFDVDVIVQRDGSALVTETVTFRYEGGPFTYAFRGIPTRFTDGISDIQVSEGGRVYQPGGAQPGQVERQDRNNEIRLTWHFPETSDMTRTFTVSYRVEGVVREDGGAAELRWAALPTDHDYTIGSSLVTVQLPPGVSVDRASLLAGRGALQAQGDRVIVEATDIPRNGSLTLGVWMPLRAFSNVPPAWQAAAMADAAWARPLQIGSVLGGVLILALGLPALVVAWLRSRGESVPGVRGELTGPPDDLPPGLVGALVGRGSPLATLLDLARRGVLEFREQNRPGFFGVTHDFAVALRDARAPLQPYEQAILTAAFSRAAQPTFATSEEMGKGLQKAHSQLGDTAKTELRARGLVDLRSETVRGRFILAGLALLFVGTAVLVGLVAALGVAGIGTGVALMVLGIVALLFSAAVAVQTAAGQREASAWEAFGRYLKRIANGGAPEGAAYLEPYLAYAAAFGLESKWIKQYTATQTPPPAWFHPLASQAGGGDHMAAFVVVMSSASRSAGASSAASAGGGAGGAAGGGSSGSG